MIRDRELTHFLRIRLLTSIGLGAPASYWLWQTGRPEKHDDHGHGNHAEHAEPAQEESQEQAEAAPAGEAAPQPDPAPAMDAAAVQRIVDAAVAKTRAEGAEISVARDAVRPLVGELVAMDSAAAIYKVGLDHLKVDTADVPESGYKALFTAVAKTKATPVVAQDAAPTASLATDTALHDTAMMRTDGGDIRMAF